MELSSQPVLAPSTTFGEILTWYGSNKMPNFFYVSSDGTRLDGVLTRTDLLHAVESGANSKSKVAEFMVTNPIAVTITDNALVAATTMHDYELSWLPVVKDLTSREIRGYIQAQELFTYMLTVMDEVEKKGNFKRMAIAS
jgi:CBS domain-containing protein